MPVIVKKPPITAALELVPPPREPMEPKREPMAEPMAMGISKSECEAMMSKLDAEWNLKFMALASSVTRALAEKPERKGASIEFKTDVRGNITGANIIPKP